MKDALQEFTDEFAIRAGKNRHYKNEEEESMYNFSVTEMRRFLRLEFYQSIHKVSEKTPDAFRKQLALFVKNLNIGERG